MKSQYRSTHTVTLNMFWSNQRSLRSLYLWFNWINVHVAGTMRQFSEIGERIQTRIDFKAFADEFFLSLAAAAFIDLKHNENEWHAMEMKENNDKRDVYEGFSYDCDNWRSKNNFDWFPYKEILQELERVINQLFKGVNWERKRRSRKN